MTRGWGSSCPSSWHLSSLLLFATLGCASVDPAADYERVARDVHALTGSAEVYRPDGDHEVAARVAHLLQDGVSASEAVEVALLQNYELQALMQRLGVARADVVQAGLLSNPSVGAVLRVPTGGGVAGLDLGLTESLLQLLRVPHRKKLARRELLALSCEISSVASRIAARARSDYWRAVGAAELGTVVAEASQRAGEWVRLAEARREAGDGTELEVSTARGAWIEQSLAAVRGQAQALEARLDLLAELGIDMRPEDLLLTQPVSTYFVGGREGVRVESLFVDEGSWVALALANRRDLLAAEHAVEAAQLRAGFLGRDDGVVEVGAEFERAARRSGERRDEVWGPSVLLELPIFDRGQARAATARYSLAIAEKARDGLRLHVALEVRRALRHARVVEHRERVLREELLTLRLRDLDLAQRAYQLGEVPFLAVLEAGRSLFAAQREAVEARVDVAVAWSELGPVVGLSPVDLLSAAMDSSAEVSN